MQNNIIAINFRDDDDSAWEKIPVHVAIAPSADSITFEGMGELDIYPMQNSVGITVTSSTGLTMLVSLPIDTAESVFAWALRVIREAR